MSIPGGGQGPNLEYNVSLNLSPVEAAARRLEALSKQLGETVSRNLTIQGRVNLGAEQVADHLQRIQQNVARANQGIVANTTATHTAINNGWGTVVRAQQQAVQQSQQNWANYYRWLITNHQTMVQQLARAPVVATPTTPNAPAGGGGFGPLPPEVGTIAGAAARGFGRGLGAGAGVPIGIGITGVAAAGIAAAAAVENVTRAVRNGVTAGIEYNASLELAALTMKQLTGSSTEAAAALSELRKYADITPFNTQEVIQSGQAFLRVAQGSREEMLQLVQAAGALATTNPAQGLEGATYAIRELLSGDVQSIADRFNVSRRAIRGFMEEGLTGIPLVTRVLQELGVSLKTVEEQNKTFAGSLSNVTSFAENFMQALTSGIFEGTKEDLLAITEYLKNNGDAWLEAAAKLGKFIDLAGDFAKNFGLLGQLNTLFNVTRGIVEATTPNKGLASKTPEEQAISQASAAAKQQQIELTTEQAKGKAELEKTKDAITANQAKLQEVRLTAAQITAEYHSQLVPLQRQLDLVNRPNFERQRASANLDIQQAQLNQARQGAQAPVEQRAQAAAALATLDVQEKLSAIESRRAEIAEDYVDFAQRGKTALELQATALEKQVQGMQRMQQAMQEIRTIRMEGLREETQAASEARTVRLDALREEQRLAGDARTTRLDALREEQRVAKEQRDEVAQNAKDLQERYDEAYQAIEKSSDRAHRAQMQNYEDEINALRKQEDELQNRGPSAAEKELEGLDASERARSRKNALDDARNRVNKTKTIGDRSEAISDLNELQRSQAVDVKRESLQQRIKAEKEAEDRKREQIEQKIAQIQEVSRNSDRSFQAEKEQREIAREAELSQRREAERQAEATQREIEKQEREVLRAAELKAKQEERVEKESLRKAELADRAADKAEQVALKAQEKADRDAERQERYALQDAQRLAETTREAATLQREQREEARQAAQDVRQAKQNELELTRLGIEEGLLKAQDNAKLAQIAAAQVRLDNTRLTLQAEESIETANKRIVASGLEEQITAIKDAEYERLEAVNKQVDAYQLQAQALELLATQQKVSLDQLAEQIKEVSALRARIRQEDLDAAKAKGDGEGQKNLGQQIFETITTGLQNGFNNDKSTADVVDQWVSDDIIAPAFDRLESQSPSQVFMRLADACVEGFNLQIDARQQETYNTIDNMFNNAVTTAIDGVTRVKDNIQTAWDAIPGIFQTGQELVVTAILKPFNDAIALFPGIQQQFNTSGINSVTAWINGWNANNIYTYVLKSFQDIIDNILNKVGEIFKNSGIQAALGWLGGFREQIDAGRAAVGSWITSVTGIGQQPQQQQVQQQQQQPVYRNDPLPPLFSRAMGGPVYPGNRYRWQEDQQFVEVFQPGSIRTTGAAYAGYEGNKPSSSNITVTIGNGAVQVQTGGNIDERALGEKIGKSVTHAIITAIDEAQRFAPNPVSSTLGGAE